MVEVPAPFIKTTEGLESPSFPIGAILRRKSVPGDIGIEIEVEGNIFPKTGSGPKPPYKPELIPDMWSYHHDGSLRGKDNAEYVLTRPLPFSEVENAIIQLWKMFDKCGSVLDESNRTSVHVHLNMQKFHLNRLTSFFALYFTIEELLTSWCGEHRVGNLFCLRAKDAPAIVSQLKKFIISNGRYELRDGLHYSGLNAQALYKFGSVEIRTLRGVNNPTTILDWVAVLRRLYELSAEFTDPRNICDMFSSEGPMGFLDTVLGDKKHVICDNIGYTYDQIRDATYNGIRLAQDLCYCRDWGIFNPVDLKEDPFGRDAKKVGMSVYQQLVADMLNNPPTPITQTTQHTMYTYNLTDLEAMPPLHANTGPIPDMDAVTEEEEEWLNEFGPNDDEDEF